MTESRRQLIWRTKHFALETIKLTEALPHCRTADVIGRQLLRSATSVAANYRSACRAKSSRDFIAKMGTVEEEADESLFWLDLLQESGTSPPPTIQALRREADELIAMTVASVRTARRNAQLRTPHSALRTRHE